MACANGACVVVTIDGDTIHVTDSKNPDQPALTYTFAEWQTEVLDEIEAGGWLPEATYRNDDDSVVLRRTVGGPTLTFTEGEWDDFVAGVHAEKFSAEALAARGTTA